LLCGEFCIGNAEVNKLPERLGIDGKIILKYIIKERNIMGRCVLDSSVLGTGPVAVTSEHDNESSGS
jgi:hypothetical protein